MRKSPSTFSLSPTIVLLRAAFLIILVGMLFRWELAQIVEEARSSSEWTHLFALPIVGLAYVLSRKQDILAGVTNGSAWGYLLVLGGVCIRLACFLAAQFGYARSIGMLVCASGALLVAAGWRVFRICLPLILMFGCCLPLTERVMGPKSLFLQRCSIHAATSVLNHLPGMQARANGMTIDLLRDGTGVSAGLAEQRFGAFGLPGCCLLGLYVVFSKRRPIWEMLLLVLIGAVAVLTSNVLRIVVWAAIQSFGVFEPTDPIPRDISLATPLLTTYGLLAGSCWLLPKLGVVAERLCTVEVDEASEEDAESV